MNRWLIVLAVSLGLLAHAHASWRASDSVAAVHIIGNEDSQSAKRLYAFWQSRDSNYNVKISAATFQGPGDVVSGSVAWGSCARVYDDALASTSTSLCDLVSSSAPTTVLCTLRGTSSGFVDLSAYCAGAITPAATCALATGGVCNVSKVYDQAGSTGGWIQATAANQGVLTFSGLKSLPGIICSNSGDTSLVTLGSVTITQPFSTSVVGEATAAVQGTWVGATGNSVFIGQGSTNNWIIIDPSGAQTSNLSAAENAYHAGQGVYPTSGGTLTLYVDGTSATGTAGSGGITTALRICRQNAQFSPTGIFMEGGFWPSGFNSTQAGNLNTNQHSATNGYNF